MIRLVDINEVRPSAYNPRVTDPARLDLIELSLRKLGFVLPIYADADGEILSGHQRHMVAARMGIRQVPVAFTKAMNLADRKAINIAFNRGTNDLKPQDTPEALTKRLSAEDVAALAEDLPDIDIGSPAFFACLNPRPVPLAEMTRANAGRWINYARNLARVLDGKGVQMPVVAGPDLIVVNGIGRLHLLAEQQAETVPVVEVSAEQARFAQAMLNCLSMDFDIHTRYADVLRHNSFRRARQVRQYLGRGFVFAVFGHRPAREFDIARPDHLRAWTKEHGRSVIDFGAGLLVETGMLRQAGIDVTPFEPYRLAGAEIDKSQGVELASTFLAAVASGKRWDSIFLASVLNSVPFESDRRHIVTICASLCDGGTKLYALAQSRNQSDYELRTGQREYLSRFATRETGFHLGYEPGITLAELSNAPKVQKYHLPGEFEDLFTPRFRRVTVATYEGEVNAVASLPQPLDPAALSAALEFEFDLPYPDGSRMGLAVEAKAAFSKRLGVAL